MKTIPTSGNEKHLICPFFMSANAIFEAVIDLAGNTRNNFSNKMSLPTENCIKTNCMMWRYEDDKPEHKKEDGGYCGLSKSPYKEKNKNILIGRKGVER